jgi:hypothetical protein
LPTFVIPALIPPALVDPRFFFTLPPSFDKKSGLALGDVGALPVDPWKYSLVAGADDSGDPGMVGEFEPAAAPFHCRPSMGRYVLTFSPMHERNAPDVPGVPGSGIARAPSYTSNAILCSCETGSPQTSAGAQK